MLFPPLSENVGVIIDNKMFYVAALVYIDAAKFIKESNFERARDFAGKAKSLLKEARKKEEAKKGKLQKIKIMRINKKIIQLEKEYRV
jgi:hypothetical protein